MLMSSQIVSKPHRLTLRSRAERGVSKGWAKGEVCGPPQRGLPRAIEMALRASSGCGVFRQQSPKLARQFGVIVRLGQDRDVRVEVARVLRPLRRARGQDDFQAGPLPA